MAHRLSRAAGTPRRPTDSLSHALASAATCLSSAEWVAVTDSVLRQGISPDELMADILTADPSLLHSMTKLMARTSRLSESGTESLLRHDLVSARLRVRAQVWIGSDRVDLLVGDRLVLECDSRAHHTRLDRYTADRLRDQRLAALGFHVLRFTYHQLVHDRSSVVALVLDLTRRGVHLSGRVHRVESAS